MTVHSILAKVTGEKRGAPEGVWVQGGGIELPGKHFFQRPKNPSPHFYLYLRPVISMYKPSGAYSWRGDLTKGFLRYNFGGLIHEGAYFRYSTVMGLHLALLS